MYGFSVRLSVDLTLLRKPDLALFSIAIDIIDLILVQFSCRFVVYVSMHLLHLFDADSRGGIYESELRKSKFSVNQRLRG